ncbi:MAG: hypothetical protein P4L16_04560 [Chlamydiales bacterium]|nr:hypothetical protein [Chlamydiales bacterium]
MILIATALFILISIICYSLYNGVAPVPTSFKVRDKLLHSLPQEVNNPIVELGTGFGTLFFTLPKCFPHHTIIGYENSLIPFLYTWLLLKLKGCRNVSIYKKNFFSVSLEGNGLILCYLYPGAMEKLAKKFKTECKKGTWFVSHTFALPGITPLIVYEANDLYKTKIYLYKSSDHLE